MKVEYEVNSWKSAGYRDSLAIMSVYDSDGIVDDFIIFYLSSLKTVADRIIVVVNGKLTVSGEHKLRTITDEIYIRENIGFDFGAYKDVLEYYLKPEEIKQYQELILCNDTCFGPLVSFKEIFYKMRDKTLEMWSINYIDDILLPHFQSYFMVFRKNAIRILLDFLHREVDSKAVELAQAHGYEHGLSEVLLMNHVKSGFYTSKAQQNHNIDIFKSPDYAIKYLGFPMLKRKVFSEDFYIRENCAEALRLIDENTEYPFRYIQETVKRVYHRKIPEKIENSFLPELYTFGGNEAKREQVIEFCNKHKKIYVYGTGYMSELFMARFGRYVSVFGGYIVSDEFYRNGFHKGQKIYPLSDIERNVPIIIALMRESTFQVMDKMCGRENVLFLSVKPSK